MTSKAGKTRYGLVCYGLLWCFYIFCCFCIILKQKFVILFLKHILNSDVRKPMNDGWMDDVCMYKRADICVYGRVSLYTYLTYVCKVCAHNEHQNKIEITTIMRIKVEYWWNKLKSYRKTQFEYKIKKKCFNQTAQQNTGQSTVVLTGLKGHSQKFHMWFLCSDFFTANCLKISPQIYRGFSKFTDNFEFSTSPVI